MRRERGSGIVRPAHVRVRAGIGSAALLCAAWLVAQSSGCSAVRGPGADRAGEAATGPAEASGSEGPQPGRTAQGFAVPASDPVATESLAAGSGSGDAPAGIDGAIGAAAPRTKEPPPAPTVSEVAQGPGMLEGEAYDIFWGTREDPPTDNLDAARPELEGRHFLRSDERNHHAFMPYIRDLGGAYAGVGAEQAYTFASWSRARLVWLTDYDPWITEVHRIYAAFFLVSPDIASFRNRLEDEQEDKSIEILRHFYGEEDRWELMDVVFDALQERARRRVDWMVDTYRERDIDSWVTDEEHYRYVRTLVKQRRVRPMLANLLDDEAFVEIGRASRELGVPMRVLYLSNAESYWGYSEQFRANMGAQHFDARSVILRTNGAQGSNGDYRYAIQPAPNYVAWLQHPEVEDLGDIWRKPSVREWEHIPLDLLYAPPAGEPARGEPLAFERPAFRPRRDD